MSSLILVRHGVTDWNVEGRWHGLTDIPLNEEGKKQSREAANTLKGIQIDIVYTSPLKRVTQTYDEIKETLGLDVPMVIDPALNERDYGIYTGKNKWEVEKFVRSLDPAKKPRILYTSEFDFPKCFKKTGKYSPNAAFIAGSFAKIANLLFPQAGNSLCFFIDKRDLKINPWIGKKDRDSL